MGESETRLSMNRIEGEDDDEDEDDAAAGCYPHWADAAAVRSSG